MLAKRLGQKVDEHEGGDGVRDRGGSPDDTGVVAAPDLQHGFRAALQIHAALFFGNGWGGLHRHADDEGHAGGDAAQHAAVMIGFCDDFIIFNAECIIVFTSQKITAAKTGTKFNALNGGNTKNSLGKFIFYAVKRMV